MGRGRKFGWEHPTTAKSAQRPTMLDIAWAAGIFEGEGSIHRAGITSQQATVTQKDRWLLERLLLLFGGKIHRHDNRVDARHNGGVWTWYLNGGRARGFVLTIYKFLSPRRQAKIALVLGGKEEGWGI